MIVPVILAGGIGTRLWPLSRESYPKQFIPLIDEQSLFQQTLLRIKPLIKDQPILVIGNEDYRFIIAEQLRQLDINAKIILEPEGKNTAPAIMLAAFWALAQEYDDPKLLVLPADHVLDQQPFLEAVDKAQALTAQDKLTTFGVLPTCPHTGYGYIKKGASLDKNLGFGIEKFVEKPNEQTAKQYLESKNYYWNSGMFMFGAKSILAACHSLAADIYSLTQKSFEYAEVDKDFIRPHAQSFAMIKGDSIDYAIMEKTKNGAVVPLEGSWSDVGSWDPLAKCFKSDSKGNVVTGDVIVENSEQSFLYSKHRLLVAVGVKDLIVVETPDAVLVLDRKDSEQIKHAISKLRAKSRKELTVSRRVSRPWGAFEAVDQGQRFQVKHITVNTGQRLSLQIHHHRSEHWVVVQGTARVTRGDEVFLLSENQSTYIPIGVAHRLENVGKIPLEIIEVQSGSYLGEDDIIRLDDVYGRLKPEVLEKAEEAAVQE